MSGGNIPFVDLAKQYRAIEDDIKNAIHAVLDRGDYILQDIHAIPAGPTGYYGTKTVEAVKRFQLDQGWPASQSDGIPGTATLKLLGLR